MNKYIIELTRITYSTQTVEVIADNYEDAIDKTDELAWELDFPVDAVDYEYALITSRELDKTPS